MVVITDVLAMVFMMTALVLLACGVMITDVVTMVFMMTAFVLLACGASDNADNHRLVAVLKRLSVVSMQTIGAGDDDTAGSHATASNVFVLVVAVLVLTLTVMLMLMLTVVLILAV